MTSLLAYLRRHHLALLALFVALGGTSYAAMRLPAGSVGTEQIRSHAVTPPKLSRKARSALRGRRGPRGKSGPFTRVLPSGATLSGAYAMAGYEETGDAFQEAETGISFGFRLATAPAARFPAAADPANCPGSPANPKAEPGYLCVYQDGAVNVAAIDICSGNTCGGVAGKTGAWLNAAPSGQGYYSSRGTWAVTAP